MRNNIIHSLAMLMLVGALASCNDDTFGPNGSQEENRRPIVLSGEIEQVAVTRVNDNGFCDGDEMGVYIVDYQGSTPGTLQNSGNRGNNVKHTFDEAAYKWNSAYDVYWKDDHTHIDIYGYYPFGSPEDVNAYAFEVKKTSLPLPPATKWAATKPATSCGERLPTWLLRKESSVCLCATA